eukprot:g266.t1
MDIPQDDPVPNHERYEFIKWLSPDERTLAIARDRVRQQLVTIKVIERGPKVNLHIERELLNHSQLSNTHVIAFYEAFLTDRDLCIVQEYRESNLWQFVHDEGGRLQEGVAQYIFVQLLEAVTYCHSKGIVNRDIKLESCVVKNVHKNGTKYPLVKICDFEYCKNMRDDSMPHSLVGTAAYLSLDVIESNSSDAGRPYQGELVDVWNCGISLYFLLEGDFPFGTERSSEGGFMDLVNRIKTLDYKPCTMASIGAQDLLYRIICPRSIRLNLEGIKDHWWVRQAYQREDVKILKAMTQNYVDYNEPRMNVEQLTYYIREARLRVPGQ